MPRLSLYLAIAILCVVALVVGACAESPTQTMTATPVQVPTEGSAGEHINVIIEVSSLQPCRLVLSTPHRTEIDNYLAPYTTQTLTYPDSDGTVVFRERIPAGTTPGSYVLKVMQMESDDDTEGTELSSRTFVVR